MGEDSSRPIESALARVKHQVEYQQIDLDVLQIAASYAVVISRAHSFSDGNKRTAMMSMVVFLDTHGFSLAIDDEVLGEWMIKCAAGEISDTQLWSLIFEYITVAPALCDMCGAAPVESGDTSYCVNCETLQRQLDRG